MPDAAGRRLTEQGRERKRQLLDCAEQLFAEHGYAETRVLDICAAAGVAKGLFYWYFENKEQLFADLVRSMRLRLRQAQADAMDPSATPLARIRQGTEASVRFMAEHQAFFAHLGVRDQPRGLSGILREGTDVHTTDTAVLIKDAQALGLVREDRDPELLALGVVGAVGHFSYFHRVGRIGMPVDELARFVGDWVEAALVG